MKARITDLEGLEVEGTPKEVIDFMTQFYDVQDRISDLKEKANKLEKRLKELEKNKGGKRGRPKKQSR